MIEQDDSSNNEESDELEDIAVLCAERVSQMTRTYNDVDAVSSLLEEKERDLELAARIGQTLLSKNKDLVGRKEALEEQLSVASDTIKQLKHELSKKVQQLEVYDQDLQYHSSKDNSASGGGGDANRLVEKLQRQVGSLEEENHSLRLETAQLLSDTESHEEKEKKLVEDCLQQFSELNQQVDTLTEDLKLKKKESGQQREEINSLVSQLNETCQRVKQLTEENADLVDKLQAAQEAQTQFARELSIQKDKYDELLQTWESARDELRVHRQGSRVRGSSQSYCSSPGAVSVDSLAFELQHSLSLELSQDDDKRSNRSGDWKIFETARAARKAASKSRSNSLRLSPSASSCWDSESLPVSVRSSDTESIVSDGYSGDMDSVHGSASELGRPGIPGSNDLQSALRRLAMSQGHQADSSDINRVQRDTRSEGMSPFRIPGTPDSMSSTPSGYSYLSCGRTPQSSHYKLSNKLQIVKPMEGSATLRQWQQLAQPHLGGLFERRDGVKVKGERKIDLEEETYTLSDFEEDDVASDDYPGSVCRGSPDQGVTPHAVSPAGFQHNQLSHPSFTSHHAGHRSPASHRSVLSPPLRGSSPSLEPVAASTPLSQPVSKVSSSSKRGHSYTMSLGLAAVLQDRDTSLARALMKTSTSTPSFVSGGDAIAVIPAESIATVSPSSPLPQSSQDNSSNSLFSKLISSGYSLLWNKPAAEGAQPQPTPAQVAQTDGGASAKPTKVFPNGTSGVLGAITTFRKNGIL